MGFMTIDGMQVEFTDEKNILAVIHKAGIDMPTLCYHSELSIYGACRLCTVEDDKGKTFASCSEPPRDGLVIYTNTPRLMRYRKIILELLLAAHNRDCTTCNKNGFCRLQELAYKMRVHYVRFQDTRPVRPLDLSSPSIVRDPNKCILCGDCVRVCADTQGINAIDFANRGTEAMVTPAFNKKLAETNCVNCGQCRVVCPTGAISVKTNMEPVWDALADPNTIVVAQVAPAVRVALGDRLGAKKGENVMGKLVNVLHRMGFDEVYDTTYSADLTVIEEGKEFLERLSSGKNLPLFTSCCPAWVKFCENKYPELKDNISTCRSPMQMFGAVIREYYRDPERSGGKKLVSVAIMPCTAKKEEILRPESTTNGVQDVDYVLTTSELASMIRMTGVLFDELEIEAADVPFGIGSGGGVIFGVTGGVTEAVLRSLQPGHDRAGMNAIKNCGVRGTDEIKTAIREMMQKKDKDEIKKLGDVNVNAIEEFKEVTGRYDFLKNQHDDIVKTEEQLTSIIEELDSSMRKQFSEKFADIGKEFDKVFKEMFGGGKGTVYAGALNSFREALGDNVAVYSMVVPTAGEYYLPEKYAPNSASHQKSIDSIDSQLEGVISVPASLALWEHTDEPIYTRTDHHWQPLGAYYSAKCFAETAGVPFADISTMEQVDVPGYMGTMYSFTESANLLSDPETFTYYKPTNSYTTYYYDRAYNFDYQLPFFVPMPTNGSYSTFMGGDDKIVRITTDAGTGRKLVVFKDSYGNAEIPFYFGSFDEIWVCDMRYFDLNAVEFVEFTGATDLLFTMCTFSAVGTNANHLYTILNNPVTGITEPLNR